MLTRDDDAYWEQVREMSVRTDDGQWIQIDIMPGDDNFAGLYRHGPQEKHPSWRRVVRTGDANRAPETETREAILARKESEKQRRLELMAQAEELRRKARVARAMTGQRPNTRNRKRKAA